jgi:hypothetical protein
MGLLRAPAALATRASGGLCNCLYLAVAPDSVQSGFELVCCHELLHIRTRPKHYLLYIMLPTRLRAASREMLKRTIINKKNLL